MEAFETGQELSAEALKQLEKLAKERIDAERDRQQTGLDADTFTIYWELKREGIEGAKALAKISKRFSTGFPITATTPKNSASSKQKFTNCCSAS